MKPSAIAYTLISVALFPLFAIGVALLVTLTAFGIEVMRSVTGAVAKCLDHAAARMMAMRI